MEPKDSSLQDVTPQATSAKEPLGQPLQKQVQQHEGLESSCPCNALLQRPGALGRDGLFEDGSFPPSPEQSTHDPVSRKHLLITI